MVASGTQAMPLLSLPDDLMQHVLIEVVYGGPIEQRNRKMPPLDALEKLCSRDENPGATMAMDYFQSPLLAVPTNRYLPEDNFDGGGTCALVGVMLVSKAMHDIVTRCHNLWAVPLKLLSSSVEKGDLEYDVYDDCYAWMDPRLRDDWSTKSTHARYGTLRTHVSLCRKTLFAALEDGLPIIRQWMEGMMRANVYEIDLVHEPSVWVDNNNRSNTTMIVRAALRFHFVHKYAECGPTSIDVLDLLHAGWAAVELETTNRDSLFEICMDMLGYEHRWVEGMGEARWVYYTEDTDEEGSFEGDSESEEAPEEADQEEEIDA